MNVAIIGCNTIGRLHARMAANCGLKIAACADKYLPVAQALALEHGADASDDAAAAIARADVDIVAVTTPTPTHIEFVKAAALAGKHVFCEKPFCRTVEQCKEAIAAAKAAKVKLFVGHVLRYFHEFEAIRGEIEAGKIGKVGFVKLYRGGLFPGGMNGWFRNYELSGGVTLDSMIHDMDWLRYVFGDVERVFCQALRRSAPEPQDYSMATLRMKNGIIAKVIGNWAQPSGFRVEAEVCGSKGMITYSSEEAPISTVKRVDPSELGKTVVPASPVPVSPYQLEWEDFLGWIRGVSKPRVTPEDGLKAVRLALAALQSAETGKPVRM